MRAERWKQIEELYQAALAEAPEKRAAFLAQACPDDPELRGEVQSLLDQQADSFLESAPLAAVRALSAGAKLGNFEIVELLGRGGMGEVWRARDARLKRDVAIKVLPAGLARDPDRIARFEREARAASALNHPNIVSIYDIGRDDGTYWIASELVRGDTLRRMIEAGPLPAPKAIEIATQVAAGLAAAHAAGLVHRDLKPDNIMVTRDGHVKILDFGLAKQRRPAAESTTLSLTEQGTVVGTAGYMSPEQVRGEELDQCSDLFSFGVVLYEMLSGRRAFAGASSVEVMNAVLKEEPPDLPASAPRALDRIVRRCLDKEPDRRFQSAADLGFALQSLSLSPPRAERPKRRAWLKWAALVLTAGIATVLVYLKHEPGSRPPHNLERLTFDTGLQFGPTWSPDGGFIAYSSDRAGKFDIWVQQVGAVIPIKITTRPGHNWQPDWSPDGNQIVFRSEGEGGGLFVTPALGGSERRISSFGYHPKWSPDGRLILFGNTFVSWLSKLYIVGLDGEPPREILTDFLNKSQIAERAAAWYPASNRVSIWGEGVHGSGFWTVSLDGTGAVESRATPRVAELLSKFASHGFQRAQFRWAPSGQAIYLEAEWNGVRNIWKIAAEPPTMRFVALERLTAGPGPDSDLAISTDGKRLAYAARTERVRIWSYPFDARSGRILGDGNAVTPAGLDAWRADISPDGQKLAYVVNRAGRYELWQTSLPEGPATLLLRGPDTNPRWSPDSRRLGYSESGPDNAHGIVLLPQGGGSVDPVTSAAFEGDIEDWSPDGQWIVALQAIQNQPRRPELRIVLLPLSAAPKAETRARLVTSSQSEGIYEGIYEVRLSPNGRWIVFEAVKGGIGPGGATNATLCVVPVSGGAWTRITDGQFWDDKPRWSPDGKTIFYISSRNGFLNVRGIHFDPEQGRPQGQPFQVTSFDSPKLMVADDLGWLSMSLSHDRLVFSMKETSGSIWALHDVDK